MSKPNVAILICVSEYKGKNWPSLPFCKADAAIMQSIVTHTGRFTDDNTLCITTDTNSEPTKTAIAKFVAQHKEKGVDELLYYYSGHGHYDDNEFFYTFTDFDEGKPLQTGLTNTELDTMFRSLSPRPAVKIVDACHSGRQYIKSREDLKKCLTPPPDSFRYCYFLFSCDQDQLSYGKHFSYFTLAFAKSIQHKRGKSVRYKDILDFISDDFASNSKQTPFFVNQSDYTDVFCEATDTLVDALELHLTIMEATPAALPTITAGTSAVAVTAASSSSVLPMSLEQALRNAAVSESASFCTQDEALESFQFITSTITNFRPFDESLYAYSSEINESSYSVPNEKAIAQWLQNEKGQDYFITFRYESETYETEIPVSSYAIHAMLGQTKTVKRERDVLKGINCTFGEQPIKSIRVIAEPKLQNLPWWNLYVVLVISKSKLRQFYAIVRQKESNWSDRVNTMMTEWKTHVLPLKDPDAICGATNTLLTDFDTAIRKHLLDRYSLKLPAE